MRQKIKSRIEEIKRGGVPDGYRMTPVGVFPCDWEYKNTLGDLFSFYGGLGKARSELGDNGVCYLHYGDMHRGTMTYIKYDDYTRLPKYDIKLNGNESYLINDGDMVFLDASEDLEGTSRAVMVDNPNNMPFIAGLHTFVAKEKSKSFDKYYKQYITLVNGVKKQFQNLAVGFKVYGVNRTSIQNINVVYPKSLAEQKKIAEILMVCDEGIELEEKLIKKLEERKKALMQKLLTPQPNWQISELGKICKIKKGIQISKVDLWDKGEFPVINGGIQPSGFYNKYNANENTITISEGGNSCGYVNYMRQKFWSGGHCYTISNSKINDLYLYAYLKYIQTEIMNLRVGSGLPNVQKNAVERIKINYPKEIERQISIGELFNCIDKTEKFHILKLENLKSRRKALMQLLLTGIVRVGE